MAETRDLLLGRHTDYPEVYAPEVLQPIPRLHGREALDLSDGAPHFHGEDVWHAYEVSWLEPDGRPCAGAARLVIPATSPNLVESKSLKLYLNSINNTVFQSPDALAVTLTQDISATVGATVSLELLGCDDLSLAGGNAPGESVDNAVYRSTSAEPSAALLRVQSGQCSNEVLHSHLLRSLCPVTAQPDWATLVIEYSGSTIDRESLLQYVVSFRRHQEFHEQCVERMFCDLRTAIAPEQLSVQAFYTRRGGLDICPWRSTHAGSAPRYRLNRQ